MSSALQTRRLPKQTDAAVGDIKRQPRTTSVHEAGHAVVALHLNHPIREVSIIPDDEAGSLGHVLFRPLSPALRKAIHVGYLTPSQRLRLEEWAVIILAGGLAEKRVRGRHNHVGARADYEEVASTALNTSGGGRVADAWVAYCGARADELLDVYWSQVEKLAEALLEHQKLSGKELLAII